jgi:FkbM family methyltransferase
MGLKVAAFCDSDEEKIKKANGVHLGLPIITRDTLLSDKAYQNCNIVITSTAYFDEIYHSLIADGVPAEKIVSSPGKFPIPQYFCKEILPPVKDEIFIDAGCLDGNTMKQFVDYCSGNYKKIIGFEPMPVSYSTTVANIEKWSMANVEMFQKGLWSSEEELSFTIRVKKGNLVGSSRMASLHKDSSAIVESQEIIVQTIALDSVAGGEKVTFIKMDIEGAELEALKGAKNTILQNKPKLAICLYHKPEDIVEIPEFLSGLGLDYTFYIRHHRYMGYGETVLYAV